MQCPDRHFIYTIDKNAIFRDIQELNRKGILSIKNLEAHGNGSLWGGIQEFFTGKWWVYYDREPKRSKHLLHRKLFAMGYFKHAETGCGKCEICKVEHSKDWTTKGYCESQMWKNKTFLTLTYNNESLPKDRKLRRSDLQKFWKDLRYHLYKKQTNKRGRWRRNKETGLKYWEEFIDFTREREQMEEIYSNPLEDVFGKNSRRRNRYPIRYLNCGEYGPETKRPHYHAIIWNFEPLDIRRHHKDRRGYWVYTSKKIDKLWGKGYVIVGTATTEACAYVARYCTKKYMRSEAEEARMKAKKQQEFIGASSLGFIGYFYWVKFKDNIKANQGIVMRNRGITFLAKLPKAMQKVWKNEDESEFELYDVTKNKIGKANWEKILSQTELSESEYIKDTYRKRKKKYSLLKRSNGDNY